MTDTATAARTEWTAEQIAEREQWLSERAKQFCDDMHAAAMTVVVAIPDPAKRGYVREYVDSRWKRN